jgi:hypothetical protein
MVTQKSTIIDANRFRQTLESITGQRYVLKSRAELIHPDNKSWYVHLPIDAAGDIRNVYEADGKLVFESPILYDVFQDMEHSFSESKYVQLRETLDEDVKFLQDRNVREKYRKTIPKVCGFFDNLEKVLSTVNKNSSANLYAFNDAGWVTLKLEIETRELEQDDSRIREGVMAMTEAIRLIGDWEDQQRMKSEHKGQTHKTK